MMNLNKILNGKTDFFYSYNSERIYCSGKWYKFSELALSSMIEGGYAKIELSTPSGSFDYDKVYLTDKGKKQFLSKEVDIPNKIPYNVLQKLTKLANNPFDMTDEEYYQKVYDIVIDSIKIKY